MCISSPAAGICSGSLSTCVFPVGRSFYGSTRCHSFTVGNPCLRGLTSIEASLGRPLTLPLLQPVASGLGAEPKLCVAPGCGQVEHVALALTNLGSTFTVVQDGGIWAGTRVCESCEPCFPSSTWSLHSDPHVVRAARSQLQHQLPSCDWDGSFGLSPCL